MQFDPKPLQKPILKWAGGKRALLPQLIPHFPAHFSRYIEPFFGGGAVYLAKTSAVPSLVNDANREIYALYKVVRDNPVALMHALDFLGAQYSENHYYELRAKVSFKNEIDAAARTIYLNKTGFNGLYRQNAKGQFNVPWGKRSRCPALYERGVLLGFSDKLKTAILSNSDFAEILGNAERDDFIYCDPPYEPVSGTSSFNAYRAGGFPQACQILLQQNAVAACARGATVAISNSDVPFIRALYEGCEVHTIQASRAINSKGSGRGHINEILVILRPQ